MCAMLLVPVYHVSSMQFREPNCMGGWGEAGGWDRVLFSCEEDDVVDSDTDLERRTVEPGGTWCSPW